MGAQSQAQRSARPQRARTQAASHPAAAPGSLHPLRSESPSRSVFGGMAFALAFFLVSLFFVWTRTEVVKATYELGQLQHELEAQSQMNDKLTLELLTLKAPDRLVSVAVQKLGMQPPGEGQVRVVE